MIMVGGLWHACDVAMFHGLMKVMLQCFYEDLIFIKSLQYMLVNDYAGILVCLQCCYVAMLL